MSDREAQVEGMSLLPAALTSLDLSMNGLGSEGGKAIVAAMVDGRAVSI